ncbi:hypothetical protein M4951_06160 [Blastopirellula sp. J2-11]|uniref:DUF7002 family protein n=1 Tax=Blastopirellula sp. J2-11 TaxID=2943192 RepID=UPI0021C807FC|nr:hypothetical protein [Blastopirellula sp. J2-11]UUO07895.1 hypothetical protein M4951_06160 [Blastopirellula sp. J2-11]
MAFTDIHFTRTRPYLYHLTDRDNLNHIRATRAMLSAAVLLQQAGDNAYLRAKRQSSIQVKIGQRVISIRDQQPLHAGNITFQGGYGFADVIEMLNKRVFFWPGTSHGPISYGERHFLRYENDQPVILRVATADLFQTNSDVSPLYCRYNSGSPRCTGGKGSPRGPVTFALAEDADFTASNVVEVTFLNQVTLPARVEASDSINGPWRKV